MKRPIVGVFLADEGLGEDLKDNSV